MTQDPKNPLQHFETALSRAALSEDPSRVQALREVLLELSEDTSNPRRFTQYRAVLDLLQGSEMVETPQVWIDKAMAQIRELNQDLATQPGWLDRAKDVLADRTRAVEEVWATLVLDSYAGAALPGIRGHATLQPRQLMYESPYGTIHLQIEGQPDGRSDILGQFLQTEGAGVVTMEISLLSGETTRPNETGEFHFTGIRGGDVYLRLRHGHTLIQLEPIHLTSQEE